jgi:hypothetical protein
MRKEYGFSKSRKNPYAKQLKRQVTIRLDTVAVDYLKQMAAELGMPYQNLITLFLRDCALQKRRPSIQMARSAGAVSSAIATVTRLGTVPTLRLRLQWMTAGRAVDAKLDVRALDVRFRQLRGLQPFRFFLWRSHLRGTRAGPKPRDETRSVARSSFALRVLRLHSGANLGFCEHHVVIAARVGDHRFVIDVHDMRADLIQKLAIVRDHDQAALVLQ